VIGVGTLICIIVLAVAIFLVLKPKYDSKTDADAKYAAAADYAHDAKLPQAQADLKKAEEDVAATKARYGNLMANKNGNVSISGNDRISDWVQYCREMTDVLPSTLNKWWTRDLKRHNGNVAIPLGTLTVPLPSMDPDSLDGKTFTVPVSMTPWPARATSSGRTGMGGMSPAMGMMMSPMGRGQSMGGGGGRGGATQQGGDIRVIGTFSQVLNNVESWNNFSRLAQVDGLKLEGYSPFITATYHVTLTEFYKGSDKPAPKMNAGAAGGAGGSGMMRH
jgi:hypothetical protein